MKEFTLLVHEKKYFFRNYAIALSISVILLLILFFPEPKFTENHFLNMLIPVIVFVIFMFMIFMKTIHNSYFIVTPEHLIIQTRKSSIFAPALNITCPWDNIEKTVRSGYQHNDYFFIFVKEPQKKIVVHADGKDFPDFLEQFRKYYAG